MCVGWSELEKIILAKQKMVHIYCAFELSIDCKTIDWSPLIAYTAMEKNVRNHLRILCIFDLQVRA